MVPIFWATLYNLLKILSKTLSKNVKFGLYVSCNVSQFFYRKWVTQKYVSSQALLAFLLMHKPTDRTDVTQWRVQSAVKKHCRTSVTGARVRRSFSNCNQTQTGQLGQVTRVVKKNATIVFVGISWMRKNHVVIIEPRWTVRVTVSTWLGDGLLPDIRTRYQRYTWTLQQDDAPSCTVTYLRREYVTFIEPLNSSGIKLVGYTLFQVPFKRWCTVGDDSLQSRSSSMWKRWKLPLSTTLLSSDATSPGNPRENLNERDFIQFELMQILISWVKLTKDRLLVCALLQITIVNCIYWCFILKMCTQRNP